MPLPYSFSTNKNPTGPQLDADLAALGALTPIPCVITGQNTLSLAPAANTPTVAAYAQGMQFSGIIAQTNNGAVNVAVGALASLPAYKADLSGPIALSGNELVADCAVTFMYDAALDSGGGGFHTFYETSSLAESGGTINGNLAIAGNASIAGSLNGVYAQNGSFATLNVPSLASVANFMMDAGTTLTRLNSSLATVSFTVVPANSGQDATVTMSGVSINDNIGLGIINQPVGIGFQGRVLAAGSVGVRAINYTAASIAAFTATLRLTGMGYY